MGIFSLTSERELTRDVFDEHGYTFDFARWGCSQFDKVIFGEDDMIRGEIYSIRKAIFRCIRYPDEGPMAGQLHTHILLIPAHYGFTRKIDMGRIKTEHDLAELELEARLTVQNELVKYRGEVSKPIELHKIKYI